MSTSFRSRVPGIAAFRAHCCFLARAFCLASPLSDTNVRAHPARGYSEQNKRRTLQKEDVQMAIRKTEIFDFLVDIIN